MPINLAPNENRNITAKGRTKLLFSAFLVCLLLFGGIFVYKSDNIADQTEETVRGEIAEVAVKGTQDHNYAPVVVSSVTAYEPPVMKKLPPPPSMEKMKKKGCIADGILSEYGGDHEAAIRMINRSECEYLHRAVETWLEAPNFEKVASYKEQITKPNVVVGMFIAEAIDTGDDLYYPQEQRKFKFDEMCRDGSKNKWGEHTCVPSFEKKEYRKYLRYITEQAMDIGVQSFMFGQIHYQETKDLSESVAPEILREMREYADFLGLKIMIGAQTNDIADETYLRNFDYIEGGVGINETGNVENGPCFSRWYKQPGDWCWALLWNKEYSSKANNVFLHLDWSGRQGDDMATFALMDEKTRAKTLERLHKYYTSQGHGFLMPMLAVLPKNNGGCHGDEEGFYSADKKYSCKDENEINKLLKAMK